MTAPSFLPVTVDKRHLVTIGERLYSESIELIRELVNNAFDADATEVRVTVRDDLVRVEDNGTGAPPAPAEGKRKRRRRPKVKRLTADAVVKRLRFGQLGVSCCVDHYGEDGPESFAEGTTIYINCDHPLYRREARKAETHTMHLARLLTQEIALLKDPPRDPRKAFDRQSKLLRDAFVDGGG